MITKKASSHLFTVFHVRLFPCVISSESHVNPTKIAMLILQMRTLELRELKELKEFKEMEWLELLKAGRQATRQAASIAESDPSYGLC